ncbi:uncharacterized protein LOC123499921 [Portunus trituberculatus]|uniref:uncharacterized protein LOC123499921 n=1 Tax=Portunus trituberculatus TaxID=210409 RepID=UPI001E1CC956|nr:uncharacterized protein LOC123499921 [Portunus trituberculatus]
MSGAVVPDLLVADVELTENLYPFTKSKALSASVKISNATSVRVTQGFLEEWLKILSVGLDLWNCGTVTLSSAPYIYRHLSRSFSTFIGIGLVGCWVPEVPTNLLRNRFTASLFIKHSQVGVMRRGMLNAVGKVRYIVLEDSVVDKVEGPLAAEGSFTLSQRDLHRWNGLFLNNVTIHSLGSSSFNLTHKASKRENTHKVDVKDCLVGQVGHGGITVQGDVAVTIKNNIFENLEDGALKISVSRDLKFQGNLVQAAEEASLQDIQCQNLTEMDTNMIYITLDKNTTELFNELSFSPFSASCGLSQIFKVVNMDVPLTTIVFSHSTWVLLAILLLLILIAGGILYRWRENNKLQNQSQSNFHSYNGVSSSAQYQANQQEVNMVQGSVLNPVYDRTTL